MPVVYLHAKTSQIVRFVYSVLFFCPFVLNAQINWDVNAFVDATPISGPAMVGRI